VVGENERHPPNGIMVGVGCCRLHGLGFLWKSTGDDKRGSSWGVLCILFRPTDSFLNLNLICHGQGPQMTRTASMRRAAIVVGLTLGVGDHSWRTPSERELWDSRGTIPGYGHGVVPSGDEPTAWCCHCAILACDGGDGGGALSAFLL